MSRFRIPLTDRRFAPRLEELNGRDVPGGMKGNVLGTVILHSPIDIGLPDRVANSATTCGSKPGGVTDGIHAWVNLVGRGDTCLGSKPGGTGDGIVP